MKINLNELKKGFANCKVAKASSIVFGAKNGKATVYAKSGNMFIAHSFPCEGTCDAVQFPDSFGAFVASLEGETTEISFNNGVATIAGSDVRVAPATFAELPSIDKAVLIDAKALGTAIKMCSIGMGNKLPQKALNTSRLKFDGTKLELTSFNGFTVLKAEIPTEMPADEIYVNNTDIAALAKWLPVKGNVSMAISTNRSVGIANNDSFFFIRSEKVDFPAVDKLLETEFDNTGAFASADVKTMMKRLPSAKKGGATIVMDIENTILNYKAAEPDMIVKGTLPLSVSTVKKSRIKLPTKIMSNIVTVFGAKSNVTFGFDRPGGIIVFKDQSGTCKTIIATRLSQE